MLLKSEAELIEIEKRALKVLEYLDKQRDQFERNFPDKYPPPALEQAEQAREDFHYLMSMARTAMPASMVEAVAVRAFPFWN